MNKSLIKKKTTKTVFDSVNHTRLPKEVLLWDWARRDNQGQKGDRVEHLATLAFAVTP
jgi:hypothetical protein